MIYQNRSFEVKRMAQEGLLAEKRDAFKIPANRQTGQPETNSMIYLENRYPNAYLNYARRLFKEAVSLAP